MHESDLVQRLIAQLERVAREEGASGVKSVTLKVGALTGLSAEHLQETFTALTAGTALESTQLLVNLTERIDDPAAQQILIESIEVSG